MFSAEQNMVGDYERLLGLSSTSKQSLHFYSWLRPSLTYGYFINPDERIKLNVIKELGWDIARRPTGGGIILHPYDLAFAVIIPSHDPAFSENTLKNYAYVNALVAKSIQEVTGLKTEFMQCECSGKVNFCMSKPTQYDVLISGKKAAGAAQRKTKQGLLHQGSISISLPDKELLESILKDKSVSKDILQNSFGLADHLKAGPKQLREELRKALAKRFVA